MLFSSRQREHLGKNIMRFMASLWGCQLALALSLASAAENQLDYSTDLLSTRHTDITAPTKLVVGASDANIVKVVAQILRRQHYLRLPINDEVSSKFLDRYLDSLDSFHIYF